MDGRPAKRITNFVTGLFFDFALSHDGKHLILARECEQRCHIDQQRQIAREHCRENPFLDNKHISEISLGKRLVKRPLVTPSLIALAEKSYLTRSVGGTDQFPDERVSRSEARRS